MTWFKAIFGFDESSAPTLQSQFSVQGEKLHLRSQPDKTFHIGTLTTPTLAELRSNAPPSPPTEKPRLTLNNLSADVKELHRWPSAKGAFIQVASQFNLLEMPGPETTPEQGITGYQYDHTQGPACAMACAPATLYRNYLVPLDGEMGQTHSRQLNMLADLDHELGVPGIRMRNGYAILSADTLKEINRILERLDEQDRDHLRQQLRIGLHSDTQVTLAEVNEDQRVSQAFCSALPVAYHPYPAEEWAPFACLILEASYEATLRAAVQNYQKTNNPNTYLTLIGGGAFGNKPEWILAALLRALHIVKQYPLNVYIVSFGYISPELVGFVETFNDELKQ